MRFLDTEMRDGKWLVSGLGLGAARCPECDALSSRRHGWRIRQLQDLPFALLLIGVCLVARA